MQFRNQGESMAPAYFRNAPRLLLVFVVLSTLAHGLPFLFSTKPSLQVNEHRFGATIISTVLAPAKDIPAAPLAQRTISAPQPEKRTNKTKSLAKTPETIKTAKISNITARRKTELNSTPNTGSETNPLKSQNNPSIASPIEPLTTKTISTNNLTTSTSESLANQREQQRNYLLGELQNRLNRYLTYPTRARKRGWQGEALIAFNIDNRGQLNNVRLAHSSGYALLDHSAISAFAKLDRIELPSSMGLLQVMELQLPVRYELRES
jgi:protein TonB